MCVGVLYQYATLKHVLYSQIGLLLMVGVHIGTVSVWSMVRLIPITYSPGLETKRGLHFFSRNCTPLVHGLYLVLQLSPIDVKGDELQ